MTFNKGGLRVPFFILLLILSAGLGYVMDAGAAKGTSSEKDIIERAAQLGARKERKQALELLSHSLAKETNKKTSAYREILTAFEEIALTFYSDKAQQLYELGLSLRMTNPTAALQRLTEASRIEADNVLLRIEKSRLQAALGDCSKADELSRELLKEAPVLEAAQLLAAQTAVCQSEYDRANALRGEVEIKSSTMAIQWLSLEAHQAMKQNQHHKVLDLVTQMKKLEPRFPETDYWQWRAERALKKDSEKSAQSYLNSCKSLSPRLAREFSSEVNLCSRIAEVDQSIKRLGGEVTK